MANKILQTLTLDGVSMDILNDRLPKALQNKEWGTPATAYPNYNYRYNIFTAEKTGLVILLGRVTFESNPTGYRMVTIDKNVNGSYIGTGASIVVPAATSIDSILSTVSVFRIRAGEAATLTFSHGSSAGINITALARWILIPDEVGGVVRHLKSLANSICYRPLNFGKAVA